jgi:hypothetical protein
MALEDVFDRGRGRGTGEANTADVPIGNPRNHSQANLFELAVQRVIESSPNAAPEWQARIE